MPTSIPPKADYSALHPPLTQAGLQRIHQGKVRDTYSLPDHPDLLLVVSTNRISIFDFVLPAIVLRKGSVLTAMTVFWLRSPMCTQNHLVAYGAAMDGYLPKSLHRCARLRQQALIVKKLRILPVECIVRGYLTGSGWASYQKTGMVCGIPLPAGLSDGSKLPEPIFTPTTKAETGHDEHLTVAEVEGRYGKWLRKSSIFYYEALCDVAEQRGLILADTKFEFSEDGILADEVGTPDSSRFWNKRDWEAPSREGRSPAPLDKQLVRDWGKTAEIGITRRTCGHQIRLGDPDCDPTNPEHLRAVSKMTVPESIIKETTYRYLSVFLRLVGKDLASFQHDELGA